MVTSSMKQPQDLESSDRKNITQVFSNGRAFKKKQKKDLRKKLIRT